jgi:hypothetical protein
MAQLEIGSPLPPPYFLWSQNAAIAAPHRRKCKSCGFLWRTVEVPLSKKWPPETRADYCPLNQYHVGRSKTTIDPNDMQEDVLGSVGVMRAMLYGAAYRRRECSKGCKWPEKKTPVRWSTIEVMAHGLIVAGVDLCPRCKKYGMRFKKMEKRRRSGELPPSSWDQP